MGKFSQADLLNDEMSMIGHSDFISKIIRKMKKESTIILTMHVPLNLYLRGEVFCEDIEELSEIDFGQNNLMDLLYHDFLLFAKKNPDPAALFKMLTSLDHNTKKEARIEKSWESESVFKVVREEREQTMKKMQLIIKWRHALRGEVLLADMEEVQPKHGFTLEKVLELLYIDFIDKFRRGNNVTAVKNILQALDLD